MLRATVEGDALGAENTTTDLRNPPSAETAHASYVLNPVPGNRQGMIIMDVYAAIA